MPDWVFIHSALDDAGLTPAEFRVYAHIARRAGKNGDAWPSARTAAIICRIHPDSFWQIVRRLEEKGMIERQSRSGATSVYSLTEPSKWKPLAAQPTGKEGAPPKHRHPETRGGEAPGKRGHRAPEFEGCHPPGTKGHEGIPVRKSTEGNPRKVLGEVLLAPTDDSSWLLGLKTNPAYSGIDVDREYHKAAVWCQANRKALTRRRFINWLNRVDRPLSGDHGGYQRKIDYSDDGGWGDPKTKASATQ